MTTNPSTQTEDTITDSQGFYVYIHLKHQSHTIRRNKVRNTYEKGSFYVVEFIDMTYEKYPIQDIFRIIETDN